MSLITILATALLLQASGALSFDTVSYDFGAHPRTDEVLSCDFTFTNVSRKPVRISYAVATCSCTKPGWSKELVQPGAQGVISVVYHKESKDSFEKFISVFAEGETKPYVLRIAGSFFDNDESLSRDYPFIRGEYRLETEEINLGNINPGVPVRYRLAVINTAERARPINFTSESSELVFPSEPKYFTPNSRENFVFSVVADSLSWGKRTYTATPVVGGVAYAPITMHAVVIDSFKSLTREQKANAPYPVPDSGAATFGPVYKGQKGNAVFGITNSSQTDTMIIRAAYCESEGVTVKAPKSIPPGERAEFKVTIAPGALVRGLNSFVITVVSNSPYNPVLTVGVSGKME